MSFRLLWHLNITHCIFRLAFVVQMTITIRFAFQRTFAFEMRFYIANSLLWRTLHYSSSLDINKVEIVWSEMANAMRIKLDGKTANVNYKLWARVEMVRRKNCANRLQETILILCILCTAASRYLIRFQSKCQPNCRLVEYGSICGVIDCNNCLRFCNQWRTFRNYSMRICVFKCGRLFAIIAETFTPSANQVGALQLNC